MYLLMADGLARLVVEEVECRIAHQDGRAALHLEMRLDRRADHLMRRNAVDVLGEDPHELDAAARDDESREAAGAQIIEQLEHRLIDAPRYMAAQASGASRSPANRGRSASNSIRGHAGVRRHR